MSWKQMFGEPVLVIGAIIAGLQVVAWQVVDTEWLSITISAVSAVLGALIARSKVSPVTSAVEPGGEPKAWEPEPPVPADDSTAQ
jgi:hypothetical protein